MGITVGWRLEAWGLMVQEKVTLNPKPYTLDPKP